MKETKKLPSFEGVAAGATATLRMPIGLTYHTLLIAYTGVTLAQMTAVRVLANGQPIHTYTGATQIDAINKFCGRAAANGVLVLDFERYGLITRASREATAIGTGKADDPMKITTLTLEIDISADATAPALEAKAIRSAPSYSGDIRKIRKFSYNAVAAGDFEIADLPKGDLINMVRFESDKIKSIKVERNGYVIFERTKAENALVQSDGVRTPVTSAFVIDPTELGEGAEGIATRNVEGTIVSDLRFILDMEEAASVPISVTYLGTIAK